jgi:hypothetical protein
MKHSAATAVGKSAERNNPSGLIDCSLKDLPSIANPAGLGALAMTVRPHGGGHQRKRGAGVFDQGRLRHRFLGN